MEYDTTTEQNIKARMKRVIPSRTIFNATMERVTNEQSKRSSIMKAVPSPYQSLFITMRTKAIGLSLVVVAIIALVIVKTGNSGVLPTTIPGQAVETTPISSDAVTPSGSADEIIASLIDDATAEGAVGASEEQDGSALTQDLEDYNVDDNALI